MDELAGLLNRERILLELLLFKLVSLRQLLLAGEARFLTWAAEEVNRATTKVREAELRRSLAVEGLNISLRVHERVPAPAVAAPSPVTLRTLAESAPEPWRTIFAEHGRGLLDLAADLEHAVTATRRLAVSGGAAVGATLDRLTGGVPTQCGPPAARTPVAATPGKDLSSTLANLGALENRVSVQQDLASLTVGELSRQRSDLSEVNLAEATLKLQMLRAGYEAALAATARLNLPSLADFLN